MLMLNVEYSLHDERGVHKGTGVFHDDRMTLQVRQVLQNYVLYWKYGMKYKIKV